MPQVGLPTPEIATANVTEREKLFHLVEISWSQVGILGPSFGPSRSSSKLNPEELGWPPGLGMHLAK